MSVNRHRSDNTEMAEATQAIEKIMAAVFYGVSSFAVIFINKIVLTTYDFPHFIFLAAIQFSATTIVLATLVLLKKLDIPGSDNC